ncbi:GNAT family N-acetyltransferase [Albimonas pacifica]|uniref:Acetyltransferase (GNAT) family protein n=1 Tax=Albimonas pacifica TaxID=1114924 RepID=A0A1I3K108_9RHOB|nr:GNAT family N-acetyltransferase [Albimonas pacifica]SFI66209.1 Acetyltransferase (GNAT) family protein [Albimonas pacifica]
MSIVIRPLSAADEAEWRRLWTLYLAFYETTVPEEVYASAFARNLSAEHPDMNALVAERPDGQGLMGLVHYIFHRHNWRVEDVVYLQDLFVDPDVRGGGVGRSLIQAVYAAADAAGTPAVYWMTQEFNYKGRMLYDQVATKSPFIQYRR